MSRKVTADFTLKKVGTKLVLILHGFSSKLRELAWTYSVQFDGDEAPLRAEFKKSFKSEATRNMQNYLYGHLAPFALQFCQNSGWTTITTKEAAIELLKGPLGFCEKHVNEETGEVVSTNYSISFRSKAEREQSTLFIENLMGFLLENGFPVVSPERYKKGTTYGTTDSL